MDSPLVVITHRVHQEVEKLLGNSCRLVVNQDTESWPRKTLLHHTNKADALMVFMPDSVDDDFLSRCPNLKIIAAALKGYDNFDVEACTRRGIWFSVVPDLLSVPTAELALGLMLGVTRNIGAGDRLVRSGKFQGWRPTLYGGGLSGRTVGIIGMGKLGRTLARMLSGFNVTILYSDRAALASEEQQRLDIKKVQMNELLEQSDVVVVLLPLNPSTLKLVDSSTIARMKPGSYLVNVGRGSVVNEDAVADALDRGLLAGYAADVFEMEDWARPDRPREINLRLLKHSDRTLFTPHLGSAVDRVRLEIELAAARNILDALKGERPADAVNDPTSQPVSLKKAGQRP
jgi:phosphonate dehydrogenase